MGIQERTLCFTLLDIKRSVAVDSLKNMLALISRHDLAQNTKFYNFIKHNGRSISFALDQDLDKLKKSGKITIDDTINIVDIKHIREIAYKLDYSDQNLLREAIKKSYNPSLEKTNHNDEVPKRANAVINTIFTSGYEGDNIDTFFSKLLSAGIKQIIDVRLNPISRKPGFSKNKLISACKYLDMNYCHFPDLGIPSECRQNLNTQADYDRLFASYIDNLKTSKRPHVEKLLDVISKTPSTLMCYESNINQCHRLCLAKELSHLSGIKIKNI